MLYKTLRHNTKVENQIETSMSASDSNVKEDTINIFMTRIIKYFKNM